jgi:hypothetical protein
VDTYEEFLEYWKVSNSKSVASQVAQWQTRYMNKYPELLQKQLRNYEESGVEWRKTARKVFQAIPDRLKRMEEARRNILQLHELIYARAVQKLDFDFNVTFVVYVGLGCGAGWATKYDGQPAILLGLENIAEEKWHSTTKLEGMIAHEIGHLAHMKWRNEWENLENAADDSLFRLYEEGFAQRCEHIVNGSDTWHMASNRQWLPWCEKHKAWLAKEFLERLDRHASASDFFGSWFDIQGKKQTGYFLGHAFIVSLERTCALREIARFSSCRAKRLAVAYLKEVSKEDAM